MQLRAHLKDTIPTGSSAAWVTLKPQLTLSYSCKLNPINARRSRKEITLCELG